jgi:hypothetical protein
MHGFWGLFMQIVVNWVDYWVTNGVGQLIVLGYKVIALSK